MTLAVNILMLLSATVAGGSALLADAKARDRPVVIGTTQPPSVWPPNNPQDDSLFQLVNRPLLGLDDKGQWYCYLCEELPKRSDSTNGDAWHVRFRVQGTWGDMSPLTAKDFATGLAFQKASAKKPAQRELLDRIIKIQGVPDSILDVLVTVKGSEDLVMLALANLYPLHAMETNAPGNGPTKLASSGRVASAMRKNPTDPRWYLGPYFLESASDYRKWELTPAQPSQHAKIEVRFYQNPDSLKQRFLDGSVDIIPEDGLPRNLQRELLSEAGSQAVMSQPGPYFEHLDLNLRNPHFIDRNVRHALALSIDLQGIIDALGNELATVHSHPWLHFPLSPVTEPHNGSMDAAKQKLDKAGWALNDRNKRARDNDELSISLTYPKGDELRTLVAEKIKESWEKLGIQVISEPMEPTEFFDQTLAKSMFKGASLYSWKLQPFVVPTSPFHSTEVPLAHNEYQGQNISNWQNRNVDRVIETWNTAPRHDFGKAAAEFLAHYSEDTPQIPLFLWNRLVFVGPNIEGVAFRSPISTASLSAAQWHLKPVSQEKIKP